MTPPGESDGSVAGLVFPRALRIGSRSELDRVFSKGARFRGGTLMIVVLPNDTGLTRFGISISKRLGKAVLRNRVKRCLREGFRLNRRTLPQGLDVVAVPRDAILASSPRVAGDHLVRLIEIAAARLRRRQGKRRRDRKKNAPRKPAS